MASLTLTVFLVILTYDDIRYHRIPNKVLRNMIVVRFILGTIQYPYQKNTDCLSLLFGVIPMILLILLIRILKIGIGAGDLKLLAITELYLGLIDTLLLLLVSSFIFFIFSIYLLIKRQITIYTNIPFCPFVLMANMILLIFNTASAVTI